MFLGKGVHSGSRKLKLYGPPTDALTIADEHILSIQ